MFSWHPKLERLTEFLWFPSPVSVVWCWVCGAQQVGWLYSPSLGVIVDELPIPPNRNVVIPIESTGITGVFFPKGSQTACLFLDLLMPQPGTAALPWGFAGLSVPEGFDRLRPCPGLRVKFRLSAAVWPPEQLPDCRGPVQTQAEILVIKCCRGKKLWLWESLLFTEVYVCHWTLLQFLAFTRNIQCHRKILILFFSPPIIIITVSSTVYSSAFVFRTHSSLV